MTSGPRPDPYRRRRIRRAPGRRRSRPSSCPRHVAIVMDGNGRWANARGLPRTKGHETGEAALLDVVAGAIEIGVQACLGVRLLHRELAALARTRCAS